MEFTLHPILHVEDEENDSFLLGRAFVSAEIPHPIQVVRDGARAIKYLLGRPPFVPREQYPLPCLILLDLGMPRLTGLEFLNWRQTRPAFKRIPVLGLTTSRLEQDIADAYEAGINAYLVKPVSHDGLVSMAKAIHEFWLVHNTYPEPAGKEPDLAAASNLISVQRRNGEAFAGAPPVPTRHTD